MEVEFILYVKDQQASKSFYRFVLDQEPSLDVPGMTEFVLSDRCKLGLMPESSIEKILLDKTEPPSKGSGIPRCELYLYTADMMAYARRLREAGAPEISPAEDRSWGHRVAYFSDPDGHVIAVATGLNNH